MLEILALCNMSGSPSPPIYLLSMFMLFFFLAMPNFLILIQLNTSISHFTAFSVFSSSIFLKLLLCFSFPFQTFRPLICLKFILAYGEGCGFDIFPPQLFCDNIMYSPISDAYLYHTLNFHKQMIYSWTFKLYFNSCQFMHPCHTVIMFNDLDMFLALFLETGVDICQIKRKTQKN